VTPEIDSMAMNESHRRRTSPVQLKLSATLRCADLNETPGVLHKRHFRTAIREPSV